MTRRSRNHHYDNLLLTYDTGSQKSNEANGCIRYRTQLYIPPPQLSSWFWGISILIFMLCACHTKVPRSMCFFSLTMCLITTAEMGNATITFVNYQNGANVLIIIQNYLHQSILCCFKGVWPHSISSMECLYHRHIYHQYPSYNCMVQTPFQLYSLTTSTPTTTSIQNKS
jgi:hypothetical protein